MEPRRLSGERCRPLCRVPFAARCSGRIIPDKRLTGGPASDRQSGVPNIIQFKLKAWSVADIADTLDTGMTPDADFVGGNMVEVVRNTSQLTEADGAAIATCIKSLPAVEGVTPPKK